MTGGHHVLFRYRQLHRERRTHRHRRACAARRAQLARSITTDKVIAALEGSGGHVLRTSLPTDVEERLQAALDAAPKAA
jgi:hypothetical protein